MGDVSRFLLVAIGDTMRIWLSRPWVHVRVAPSCPLNMVLQKRASVDRQWTPTAPTRYLSGVGLESRLASLAWGVRRQPTLCAPHELHPMSPLPYRDRGLAAQRRTPCAAIENPRSLLAHDALSRAAEGAAGAAKKRAFPLKQTSRSENSCPAIAVFG